jgi:N6-adenosine-specific RNA methylase IME4/ParB-like chromosome segregation protein Spo0J
MSEKEQGEIRRPTEISVRERHRKDMGDIEGLKASLVSVGLLHPIVITPDGALIAGERRLRAVKELKWDWVPVRVVATLSEAVKLLKAERDENSVRKDFTPSEGVALARDLEPLERVDAKARESEGGKKKGLGKFPDPGRAKDKIARAVGVDRKTLAKATAVVEAAEREPEKFKRIADQMDRTGNVHGAYKEVTRAAKIDKIANAAVAPLEKTSRQYPIILADPPWLYEHVETESRAIENHYPTMTLDDICALPVNALALGDAILFMWATSPKLAEAIRVVEAWGFTYRTCAVWVKDKIGMGYYFRQQHELILVGVKGGPPMPAPPDRPSSVIEAPRGAHSAKPEAVYELIERMYPTWPRIELFARSPREGWDSWGNQAS